LADWVIFFMGSFFKLQKKPRCLGQFLPSKKLCINLDQKWGGIIFWRRFHKLIWSPCSAINI
jgi:hypothetical protein